MKRKSEFLLTLFGVFIGSFYGALSLNKFMFHFNGTTLIVPGSLILAMAFGLILNKIGSEIDRRRFFEGNNKSILMEKFKKWIEEAN